MALSKRAAYQVNLDSADFIFEIYAGVWKQALGSDRTGQINRKLRDINARRARVLDHLTD